MVEVVDHTYDGRRVARRTHTSVDRNALTALLRSHVGLLWTLFLQLCSSCQLLIYYHFLTFILTSQRSPAVAVNVTCVSRIE